MFLNHSIHSQKEAFRFVNAELVVDRSITYAALEQRVDALGQKMPFSAQPVLLLFEDPEEFIISFLACQKKGMVPVPMFFPRSARNFERLHEIIVNSGCELVLCEAKNHPRIALRLENTFKKPLQILSVADAELLPDNGLLDKQHPTAFIQYTSGSTAQPKGVVVSFENLAANQQMIQQLFGCDEQSVILSWLPFYHDMGLIGNLLHALHVGATCIIMSPASVVQSPASWLQAITRFKATHSGGPNFIFDLCNQRIADESLSDFDLSSLQVVYNGSEPIKRSTIATFIDKFKTCGLDPSAFYTCYGLAEATLLVSGGKYIESRSESISSGTICSEIDIRIDSRADSHSGTGEILIHGVSVTTGYLNQQNTDLYKTIDGKLYLRTGDIGCIVGNELIISGRSKEMIIINGKNYFPYDMESELAASVTELEENGIVVSYVEENGSESPLVFAEVKKNAISELNGQDICHSIDRVIVQLCGKECADILLFTPRKIERTSSGKLQRVRVRNQYLDQETDALFTKKSAAIPDTSRRQELATTIVSNLENVHQYLLVLLTEKLKTPVNSDDFSESFLELGIDSLRSVEIVSTVNADLDLNIHVNTLLNVETPRDFEEFITNLIWMKSNASNDEYILI